MQLPLSLNPIRALDFPHECDDGLHFRFRHLRLRRHVAEAPVVSLGAVTGSAEEGEIAVVIGLVDFVDEGWAIVRAATDHTVALGAILDEKLAARLGFRR